MEWKMKFILVSEQLYGKVLHRVFTYPLSDPTWKGFVGMLVSDTEHRPGRFHPGNVPGLAWYQNQFVDLLGHWLGKKVIWTPAVYTFEDWKDPTCE